MTDHEPMIHLPKEKSGEIEFRMWTDQQTVDGLNALIHWLKGYERKGEGRVPGHFDLIMHYRSIRLAILSAKVALEQSIAFDKDTGQQPCDE
jgi:hypothetical protein